ncbi:GPI transamidase component [Microsporum ferrugineum]
MSQEDSLREKRPAGRPDAPGKAGSSLEDEPASKSVVHRGAPPEKPEAIRRRSLIVLTFWLIILLLGLPMWWKTTSIYRAKLPLNEMENWAAGKSCRPVFPLHIHVHTPGLNIPEAESLVQAAQHALDDLNDFSAHHLRLRLMKTKESSNHESGTVNEAVGEHALVLRLTPRDNITSISADLQPYSERLDVFYPSGQVQPQTTSHSPLTTFIARELRSLFNEEKAALEYILSQSNSGTSSSKHSISGSPAAQGPQGLGALNKEQRANNISPMMQPQLLESIASRAKKSFKYAETYHLSFSLFTPGPAPSSWDIESALKEHLSPLLAAFSPISSFSIDTQVQVYATFSPTATPPEYDESKSAWTLKKEDLSGFINAAEWPLSPSIGGGPTINFILYVPSPTQSPLVVQENSATSWLIPQWGGVTILNPPLSTDPEPQNPHHLSREALKPVMDTFSHQLLTLLGTPNSPPSLPLRLQSLIRIHTASLLLSASSTMGSLARLTLSLPSIPIPITVANSVSHTLSHLSSTCEMLHQGAFRSALTSARVAEKEAERSFFEKSMVGQVYFPDEHKVAVYLPLLGPIGVPLVLGLIKELKRMLFGLRSRS